MDQASEPEWRALPLAQIEDLLSLPDPLIHSLLDKRATPPRLSDDTGRQLLRYWGAEEAVIEARADDEQGRVAIVLDLLLEPLLPFDESYTVWFHIVANDSDDQYMIYDYMPMDDTTGWQPGSIVHFQPEILVEPGNYDLSFGFWTPAERRRLTVDSTNAYWINLGTFDVPNLDEDSQAID